MKGGAVDVLEFPEYDEQGRREGREVLYQVERDEDGKPRGVDVLQFVEHEEEEQSGGIEVLDCRGTSHPEKSNEKRSKDIVKPNVFTEEQKIQPNQHGAVDNIPWMSAPIYPATNFQVIIICKKNYIDRNGKEIPERGRIECRIILYGKTYDLSVKYTKIRSISKIITDSIPEAIIDHDVQKVEKIIEEKFRQDIAATKNIQIFFEAGWNYIDGQHVYLCQGKNLGVGRNVETELTLPSYDCSRPNLVDIFLRACNLYKDMTAQAIMLTFSLMGVLYQLFREAGFIPRFVLFLNGRTGSMKTTIGKILFIQLCEDAFREEPRRFDTDTAVSLERAIVTSGRDTVTLIDDFAPAKTETKRREMQDKLEMIIRMVGDGSSRSRSNVYLEDKRGEGVHGMVVLTGELMGKGVSSNLRCLYCRLERDLVNVDGVTWFQENPHAYTTFIAAFAEYVGQHYDEIKVYIQRQFSVERKRLLGRLKERRLVDSAVTLRLANDILNNFLAKYCGMDNGEIKTMLMQMREQIVDCAWMSEELSKEESPAVLFVKSIASLMRVGSITLCEDRRMISETAEFDGFLDEQFFYFNPDIIHKKVVAFLGQTNSYFPYDQREIQSLLADERIIKTAPNGKGKRTLCVRILVGNGKKYNFLKIQRTTFEAVVEGDFDSEQSGI